MINLIAHLPLIKDFRREVKTWFPLDHQNLVKLLGVVPNPLQRGGSSFPGMITKWHERGHAMKYLQDKGMQGVTSLRLKIVRSHTFVNEPLQVLSVVCYRSPMLLSVFNIVSLVL